MADSQVHTPDSTDGEIQSSAVAEKRTFSCFTGKTMSSFRSSRRARRAAPYVREVPVDSKLLYVPNKIPKHQHTVSESIDKFLKPSYHQNTPQPSASRPLSKDLQTKSEGSLYRPDIDRIIKHKKKHTAWKELLAGTWKLHDVSPLHGFELTQESLRFYSKHLSATVAGHMKNITSIEETANKAEVKLFEAELSKDGAFILEFLMYKNSGNSKDSATKGQIVLRALLVSNLDPSESQGLAPGFTSAPLLLVKGPVALTDVLLNWIRSRFDCCVTVNNFSSNGLCWLVAMFAGYVPDKTTKCVQLVYKVPEEITGIDSFTYDINAEDCQKLWHCIRGDDDGDSFSDQNTMTFINAIENNFYHYFRIKLAAMKIVSIVTPTFSADCEGKIKIFSAGRAEQLLTCMQQFSL